MIIYFSATGNSKHCAQKLANALNDELIDIKDLIKGGKYTIDLSSQKYFGVVYPTFAWDMPYFIRDYFEKCIITGYEKSCYAFAVATCGGSEGYAVRHIEDILMKKGIKLNSMFSLLFPDNYILMFPLSTEEETAKKVAESEGALDEIIIAVKDRNDTQKLTKTKIPKGMYKAFAKLFQIGSYKTKKFRVNESCIGCGICENVCPVSVISIKDNKPVWNNNKCSKCLACVHNCPKRAIDYGKATTKTGRYIYPHVK